MTFQRIATVAVIAASIGLTTLAYPANAAKTTAGHTTGTAAAKSQTADAGMREQLARLTKALANGDAKELASLWTKDGIYIDESGNKYQGQSAVEQRFTRLFTTEGKQPVRLPAETVQLLSSGVGQVEGVVVRNDHDGPETRYSIVLVKDNTNWRIASAVETPIVASPPDNNLNDLAWLIGDWHATKDGANLHIKADWTGNKNFIRCTYEIKKPNSPEQVDVQIIGQDPRTRQLRSWSFDSNGGFGQSNWEKAKIGQWRVHSSGITHGGSSAHAINMISAVEPDSFTWQSIDRTIDGVALGDTATLKVERSKQATSLAPSSSR